MVHLLAALAAGAVLALPGPCLDGEPVVEPATGVAFERLVGLAPRLELTGVAVRKRFWIEIFAIGMYVDRAALAAHLAGRELAGEELAEAVLAAPVRTAQRIVFARNIDAKRIREGLIEGVGRTLQPSDTRIVKDFSAILRNTRDAKKGDEVMTLFEPDGTIIFYYNGFLVGFVRNTALAQAMKAAYLGPNSLDRKIKKDLVELF